MRKTTKQKTSKTPTTVAKVAKKSKTPKTSPSTHRNLSEYNHAYYMAHKNDKKYKERRLRNERKRRRFQTQKEKDKRNDYLREKWAKDAAYRQRILAYQKAWRNKRKKATKRGTKRKTR